MIKKFSGIFVGKLIHLAVRRLKFGGGSAAPGYYALKLYPNLIEELIPRVQKNIIITGTNGKTTTSRLLTHFAQSQGLRVINNSTGSNLERGIASTLLSQLPLNNSQQPEYDLGVWELDEAAFNSVAPKLNPDMVIFLNVFRDQMDRYGEVDSIVKKWGQTTPKLPSKTKYLINGDDGILADLKVKAEYFGVKNRKIKGEREVIDRKLDFEAKDIIFKGLIGSSFKISHKLQDTEINLPLPGLYHVYDLLAAFTAGENLGIDREKIKESLENFSPAFGRVEQVKIGDTSAYIFLIKNPTGATQVLQTLAPELKAEDRILFALNDNYADGMDVSWIWDIDFDSLNSVTAEKSGIQKKDGSPVQPGMTIFTTGTRYLDMALRLKYQGFEARKITSDPSLQSALEGSTVGLEGRLFILPTYTALLDLQGILARISSKKEYWR